MSLSHVILGWLNFEPMTGYDLNAVIEISTQHFWSTSQSQIYRTLAKLEHAGCVTQEVIQQEDRPAKKVYHITEGGQAELKDWLSSFHKPEPPRIPMLIQVFFGGQISDEAVLEVLSAELAYLKKRLGTIRAARAISAANFSPDEDPRDIFYWMLTIDFGEASIEAQIQWLEGTCEKIIRKDYQNITLESTPGTTKELEENHEK